MIANMETSTQAGRHWVVIELRHGYDFDSLADFDVMTNTFEPILLKYNNQYIFNKTKFQSEYSSTCGLYCLYYLYHRSTNSYENTVHSFASDKKSTTAFFSNTSFFSRANFYCSSCLGLMYFRVDLFHDNDVKFVELRTYLTSCVC